MSNLQTFTLPTLAELFEETEQDIKQNHLTVLLNQPPPAKFIKQHPLVKVKDANGASVPLNYIPSDRIEFMLTKLYPRWWVEVRAVQSIANSVVVTVRLFVINPITKEVEFNDGVGAAPIQTEKGSGAMDWNQVKSAAVQMAAPAAETYAFKDAAEKFGKVFGRDLGRSQTMDYNTLLKQPAVKQDWDELSELYDLKRDALPADVSKDLYRIITGKDASNYNKAKKILADA